MKLWPSFLNKKQKVREGREMVLRSLGGFGGGGFNTHDFQSFIETGYFKITNLQAYQIYDNAAPLSAAVGRIAGGLSQLMPEVVDAEGKTIPGHPVLDILKRPGFGQSYKTVMTNAAVAHLLTGDSYFITDMNRMTLRSPKPFNVDILQNQNDGFVDNYRVQIQGCGKSTEFERNGKFCFIDQMQNEIVHIVSETDRDGINGRTVLSAIFTDIGQTIEGGKHNLSLLRRGLRMAAAFMFPEEIDKEQLEYFREQIEHEKAGSENAGSSLIVPYGGQMKELSQTNRDMDYKNVIEIAAKTIAIAYKVPLPLIVSEKQTLDNFSQATLALYDDAIFPLAEIMFDKITQLMQLPDNQRLTFNPGQVPAVRMRRFKEAEIKNNSARFSVNEIRQDFGAPPIDTKRGDQILVPVNVIPLEDVGLDVNAEVVTE